MKNYFIVFTLICLLGVSFANNAPESITSTSYKTISINLSVSAKSSIVKTNDWSTRDSIITSVCNREAKLGYRLREVVPLVHTSWGAKIGTNSVYTGEIILIFEKCKE